MSWPYGQQKHVYDAGITGRKGLKEGAWAYASTWIATWAVDWLVYLELTPAEDRAVVWGVIAGVSAGGLKMLRNWLNEKGISFGPFGPTICAMICVGMLSGCSTMVSETIDEDGSSRTQRYVQAPFGKTDLVSLGVDEGVGPDGSWHRKIGSAAEGIDSTGQIEALIRGLTFLGTLSTGGGNGKPEAERPATVGQLEGLVQQLNSTWGPQLRELRETVDALKAASGVYGAAAVAEKLE